MINLLNMEEFSKEIMPVTATEFFQKTGEFHPEGLFSEYIFGPVESKERKTKYSYINLNTKVIHPSIIKLLYQLNRKILKLLSTESSFILDKEGNLIEDNENGTITGLQQFIDIFDKIKFRGGTDKRDKFILKLKQTFKENTIFIDKVPVIPPSYRDIYKDENNTWIYDELNNFYINILRKTFHIKGLSSGPLFDLMNYEIQKSVIEHDDFIRNKIQKKSGLIRSQLLGKRTDFSGRAVITPEKSLKSDEIGVPIRMAVILFEPFLIHKILYTKNPYVNIIKNEIKNILQLELNIESLKSLFKYIKSDGKISENLENILMELCEAVSYDRVLIAKRDPALHAESIRGYKPVIFKGDTIRLNVLSTGIHGADFDGDSVYSNIEVYKDNKFIKMHISEFGEYVNIEKEKTENNKNKVITKYRLLENIYINSIDPETGNHKLKKITQYSIHDNLDMYKISDKRNRFKEFWSSSDHSLLVYDENIDKIEKISPKELLSNPNGRFLIRNVESSLS
jgi:DNA-directed RNA polymerase beta' subunit